MTTNIWVSVGPKRDNETSNSGCQVVSLKASINLLMNNHYFYIYLLHLLEELVWNREVDSVISRI